MGWVSFRISIRCWDMQENTPYCILQILVHVKVLCGMLACPNLEESLVDWRMTSSKISKFISQLQEVLAPIVWEPSSTVSAPPPIRLLVLPPSILSSSTCRLHVCRHYSRLGGRYGVIPHRFLLSMSWCDQFNYKHEKSLDFLFLRYSRYIETEFVVCRFYQFSKGVACCKIRTLMCLALITLTLKF